MGAIYLSHARGGQPIALKLIRREFGECKETVATDTMPAKASSDQLKQGKELAKGTVLCTVTSDGNVAMLRITDVVLDTGRGSLSTMPDYVTTLTLWKKA